MSRSKDSIDYSLYLVTDSKLNHSSRTVAQTVEQAILGGVRIVQVREKLMGDEEFTELAKEVQAVTRKYNVPLIINDRIDIALAIDADGVHVGQRDTPARIARARIGPDNILGVSVETAEHARQAIADGADYIGIQTCFPTSIKTTPAIVQGHIGVRSILESIPVVAGVNVKTVAIGGLNESNVGRIVSKSKGTNGRSLDGVAVVTAIVGADDTQLACETLREIFYRAKIKMPVPKGSEPILRAEDVVAKIPVLLTQLRDQSPLVFHITNYVSMNDCANATLAVGGSPIMSFAPEEVENLTSAAGALVINIGTLTESLLELALQAGKVANALGKPIVLDPVGVGATKFRRQAVRRIFNAVHVDIVKGNASEIGAVAEITGCDCDIGADTDTGSSLVRARAKGVDSVGDGFRNPADIVRALAAREQCVIAMTGKIDFVSDGQHTVSINNGHPLQGRITGSGCILASVIASFAATVNASDAEPLRGWGDFFMATVSGIVCTNVAGQQAGNRADVQGPGTFRAVFLDELANFMMESSLEEAIITIC